MQFIVIGYDGKDAAALDRRMAVRNEHVALGDRMVKAGQLLFGVALLNEEKKMCGSVLVCDFHSRKDLDAWLENEPYVRGKVWDSVQVMECNVGPSFQSIVEKIKCNP